MNCRILYCPCRNPCCRAAEPALVTVITGRFQPSRRDRDERYTAEWRDRPVAAARR